MRAPFLSKRFCRLFISLAVVFCIIVPLSRSIGSAVQESVFASLGPNPFYQSLHAQFNEDLQTKSVEVRVTNIIGRAVYNYSGRAADLDADMAPESINWPKGNYFLIIRVPASGQSEVVKIQKQ